MLPGEDGLAVCRRLRSQTNPPAVIMLTAKGDDVDRIVGLRMGADDYVTKSVSLPHLLARISAMLRRAELASTPVQTEDVLARGELSIDLKRFTVAWRGRPVELTLTEFWMLHALAKFPGHVKNREQLMGEAHVVVDDSTITSHIKRIRRKFGMIDPDFDRIDTVYGMLQEAEG
jgi:two-component system OmpR family response regulator